MVKQAQLQRWYRLGLPAGVALALLLALILSQGWVARAAAQSNPVVAPAATNLVTQQKAQAPTAAAQREAARVEASTSSGMGVAAQLPEVAPVIEPSLAPLTSTAYCNSRLVTINTSTPVTVGISNQPVSNNSGDQVVFWSTSDFQRNNPTINNADGNIEIFVADVAQQNSVRQVTSSRGSILGGFNLEPSISADGTRIAFFSDRDLASVNAQRNNADGNFEIFLAVVNGSSITITQVTYTTKGANILSSISADGKYIVFASDNDIASLQGTVTPGRNNEDQNQEIFVARILGTPSSPVFEFVQVTNTSSDQGVVNDQPVISSNGSVVAFSSNYQQQSNNYELFAANVLTSGTITTSIPLKQLTNTPEDVINEQPSISDNGLFIAFVSNGSPDPRVQESDDDLDVFTATLSSIQGEVRAITSRAEPNNRTSQHPSISGDGSRVAFSSNVDFRANNNRQQQIFVYDAFITTTTEPGDDRFLQITSDTQPGITNDQPALSRDGGVVTFISNRNNSRRTLYQTSCPFADLAVTSVASTTLITAGSELNYEFTVVNRGTVTATNVRLTEVRDFAKTNFVTNPPTWSCPNQMTCTYSLGSLAPGQSSRPISYTVKVDARVATGEKVLNKVIVSSDILDRISANNVSYLGTDVLHVSFLDLDISSNPITAVLPSGQLVYTLDITNTGPSTAQDVRLTDTLDPNVTYVSSSNGGTYSPSTHAVTWPPFPLADGEHTARTVTTQVAATLPAGVDDVVNRGNVTNENEDEATDVLRTTVNAVPGWSFTQSHSNDAVPGQLVTFTLTAINTGTQAATGVVFTDRVPANTTFVMASDGGQVNASGVVSWTIPGTITVNGPPVTRRLVVRVSSIIPAGASTIANTAGVRDDGRNTTNRQPVVRVTTRQVPLIAQPTLTINKFNAGQTVQPGDLISYTIIFANGGNQDATGVVLTDRLPIRTTFVSASDGGTLQPTGVVSWTAISLPATPGSNTRTRTLVLRVDNSVPPGLSTLDNNAYVADDGTNSDTVGQPRRATDNQVNQVVAAPKFAISKTDGQASTTPGSVLTYTIRITNTGTQGATGVVISDRLPVNSTSYRSASPGSVQSGGIITWTIPGTVNVGDTVSVWVSANVISPALPYVEELVNLAGVNDDNSNSSTSLYVSTTDTTALIAAPQYTLNKSSNVPFAYPGDQFTYTISLRNTGNQAGTSTTITDTLPPYVHYVNGSARPAPAAATSQQLAWNVLTVPVGAPITFTFAVTVDNSVPVDTILNNAVVRDMEGLGTSVASPLPVRATLGDYVWDDKDGDGIQQDGELGVPNVLVTLQVPSSTPLTTTTDANGFYTFTNLIPQAGYQLQFQPALPAGTFAFSPRNQGGDDTKDSDVNPSGVSGLVSLLPARLERNTDAGFYRFAQVGNRIWVDQLADGAQEAIDTNLMTTATVELVSSPSNIVVSTLMPTTGVYSFTGVAPGSYYLRFIPPPGYRFTHRDRAPDTVDSDAYTATGQTDVFTLYSGTVTDTWDAGLFRPIPTLGNFVWEDLDGDGMYEPGAPNNEPGVPGVTVALNTLTTTIATDITDPIGRYNFNGIRPGTYTLEFVPPAPYIITLQDRGPENVDSDPDPVTGRTVPFSLTSGISNNNWDAGVVQPAQVGDQVWYDANGDGINNDAAAAISSMTVELHRVDVGQPDRVTTPTVSGMYTFTNVLPGQYTLKFNPPSGTRLTVPDVNGNLSDTVDSDPDIVTQRTTTFTLSSGVVADSWDAGLYPIINFGDRVWHDQDGDGIQDAGEPGVPNVTVRLYNPGLPAPACGGNTPITTTTTSATGNYTFSIGASICPYQIEFVMPAGYDRFSPKNVGGDRTIDSDVITSTGRTDPFTVTVFSDPPDSIDAGIFRVAQVGSQVWEDMEADGFRDAGVDLGLANVFVELERIAPLPTVLSTQTDNQGQYLFSGLIPGQYRLTFSPPSSSYEFTRMGGGGTTDDPNDSDTDSSGATVAFTLTSAVNQLNWDAGVFQRVEIGDQVWLDQDGDGQRQTPPDNLSLSGVRIGLYTDTTSLSLISVTTSTNGAYLFSDLLPNTYYLVFTPTAGYKVTQPNIGSDTTDSEPNPITRRAGPITLLSGDGLTNTWDAGFYLPAMITGTIWADNGDSEYMIPEQPISSTTAAAITVTLYQGGTPVTVTKVLTTPPDNGRFLFTNVRPGVYSMTLSQPTNRVYGLQDKPGVSEFSDSDVDPLTGRTNLFTISSGQVITNIDAAAVPPMFVGDAAWLDTNGDGLYQAGESLTMTQGITVTLYRNSDTVRVGTDTINATGRYSISRVPPGAYYLDFIAHPTMTLTLPNVGAPGTPNDQDDSDPYPFMGQIGRTQVFTITPLTITNHANWDAGFKIITATIGNIAWEDMNGDGDFDTSPSQEPRLAGVGVGIYRTSTNNQVGITVTTDVNGVYTLIVPANISYYLRFKPPVGYQITIDNQGNNDSNDSDPNPSSRRTVSFVPSPGLNDTWDAGFYRPVSIGDRVWLDDGDGNGGNAGTEGDGLINGNEVNFNDDIVRNLSVELYRVGVTPAISTTTTQTANNNKGRYTFTNLRPGTFYLKFSKPNGYVFTVKDAGSNNNDTIDSDVYRSGATIGQTDLFPMTSGQGTNDSLDVGICLDSRTLCPAVPLQFSDDASGEAEPSSPEATEEPITDTLPLDPPPAPEDTSEVEGISYNTSAPAPALAPAKRFEKVAWAQPGWTYLLKSPYRVRDDQRAFVLPRPISLR